MTIKGNNSCERISYDHPFNIPRSAHSVWITIKEKHRDYFEDDRAKEIFLSNFKILNECKKGWDYTIWTNDISLLPISKSFCEKNGIKIREIYSVLNESSMHTFKYTLLSAAKFAGTPVANSFLSMGSDIARYAILAVEGGLYLDIDYILLQNPDFLIQKVDIVAGMLRVMHPYLLASSFIAARRDHPII